MVRQVPRFNLQVPPDGMFAAAAGLLAVAITRNPVTVALVEAVMFGARIVFQIPAGGSPTGGRGPGS